MKPTIINYLRTDRTFESGLKLYMQYGHSLSLKAILNRQGNTDYNLKLLLEELRKVAGISTDDMKVHTSPAIVKAVEPVSSESVQELLLSMPEPVRKSIKLREQFPFLSKPDCPVELKILVADMLTLHDSYVTAHQRQFDALSDEQLLEVCSTVVEDYIENRQIWDELNFYNANGKVLGAHKIFALSERLTAIRSMTTPDLVKLRGNIKSCITKTNKSLTGKPADPKTAEWTAKLEVCDLELKEVNRLLGFNA
jgi:hypothetical protein